jgi:hydrogenase expression/formation protein HypC
MIFTLVLISPEIWSIRKRTADNTQILRAVKWFLIKKIITEENGVLIRTKRAFLKGKFDKMCLAIPIQINRILPDEQASGAQLGVQIQFSTAVIETPQVGDYVLVHAGIAIQKLDEADALETLAVWADIQGG